MLEVIGILAVTAVWSAAAVLCYRQGLADGCSLARQGRLAQAEQGEQGENRQQSRLRRLLGQIDQYDGRSGQEGGR